jgi:hypothetical protein
MLAGGLCFGLGGGVVIGALGVLPLVAHPDTRQPVQRDRRRLVLLVLAAGMAAQATGFLVQAGIVPALARPALGTPPPVLPAHKPSLARCCTR